jgi:hypothetical protein
MPTTELVRADNLLESAHRPDPPLQVLMVPFESVVQLRRGAMLRLGQHGSYDLGISLRFIRCKLGWLDVTGFNGLLEEGVGRSRIPTIMEVDINELAVLVNCPINVPPASADRQIGLINAPAMTNREAMHARRRNEAWGERADPVVDGTRITTDAARSEPRGDLGIAQPGAELSPNSKCHDVIRETVAAESRVGPIGHAAGTGSAAVELATLAVSSGLRTVRTRALMTLHSTLPLLNRQAAV